MEVDERLRWLEARISSSLRPRGDELRNLFTHEENRYSAKSITALLLMQRFGALHGNIFLFRTAFLAFCNHSESRRLFVYLIPEERSEYATEWVGQIRVSATPPRHLSDKALFFLKCSHASRLHRESMGFDVVYSECSSLPLSKFLRAPDKGSDTYEVSPQNRPFFCVSWLLQLADIK